MKLSAKAEIVYWPVIPPLIMSDSMDAAVIESFSAFRDNWFKKNSFLLLIRCRESILAYPAIVDQRSPEKSDLVERDIVRLG